MTNDELYNKLLAAIHRVNAAAVGAGHDRKDTMATLFALQMWRHEVELRERYAEYTRRGWEVIHGRKRNARQVATAAENQKLVLTVALELLGGDWKEGIQRLRTRGLASRVKKRAGRELSVSEDQVRRILLNWAKTIDQGSVEPPP